MQVKYRPHKETDLNFIFATLLKSYRYSNPQARVVEKKTYYENGSKEWAACLHHGGKIVVACADDDEDLIIGFVVYSGNVLHYLYVKAAFRRAGIGKSLYDKTEMPLDYYTHWTIDAGKMGIDVTLTHNPCLFKWFGYIEPKGDNDERANRSN